jgi:hypothetical protein
MLQARRLARDGGRLPGPQDREKESQADAHEDEAVEQAAMPLFSLWQANTMICLTHCSNVPAIAR